MNFADDFPQDSVRRAQGRTKPLCKFVQFLILLVLSAPAFGQFAAQRDLATLTYAPQSSVRPDPASTEQDNTERSFLAEQLILSRETPGRVFDPAFRRHLLTELTKLTLEELEQRFASGDLRTMALGDSHADLAFTPLSICRIIDTRIAGGRLVGGTPGPPQTFKVAGTSDFELQGGTPGGCGVPVGVASVLINFVAVNPSGGGNLKGNAFPNAPSATGSIINYQALTPNLNVANGLFFPICDVMTSTCEGDIILAANGAGVDIVADVLGYAARFPEEQVKSFVVEQSWSHITGGSVPIPLTSTCQTLGGPLTVAAPVTGAIHVSATVEVEVFHNAGEQEYAEFGLVRSLAECVGTVSGRDRVYEFDRDHPTGRYAAFSQLSRVYLVAPGTHTFYVRGKESGTLPPPSIGNYFTVNGSSITATFHPE